METKPAHHVILDKSFAGIPPGLEAAHFLAAGDCG